MKNIGLFLLAVVMVAGMAGCPGGGDDGLNCQDAVQCARNGQMIKACCNKAGTQCEYQTGDQTFTCNGTNCTDAAYAVANYCKL